MSLECRTRLVPALVFVNVFFTPGWLAWLMDSRPGSTLWDQLWGNLPLVCGLLLFALIPSPVLKPAFTLSEDHIICFQYAIKTGTLPLASLFTDWTTDLMERRCGLETVLTTLPAAILISAGSTVYVAAVVPGSYAYFLMSAAVSVFLGILLITLIKARLRNISSIEEQLRLQKQYLATSVTKP